MARLDATTLTEYDAAGTAAQKVQAVIDALANAQSPQAVTVRIRSGASPDIMATGTMANPWATQSGGQLVVGELTTALDVLKSGTPDANWTIEFSSGARWLTGTFGLAASGKEFTWSLSSFDATQTATLGTVEFTSVSNSAPQWSGAPTSLSLAQGEVYDFSPYASDADGDTLIYTLVPPYESGYWINSATGELHAGSVADDITLQLSDGALSVTHTVAVTIGAKFILPASTAARDVIGTSLTTGFGGQPWTTTGGSTRLPTDGDTIELADGTHGALHFQNLRGSATGRIRIRCPSTGIATIRKATVPGTDAVVRFTNCHHFDFDGKSADPSGERYCGIKITYATGATTTSRDNAGQYIKFWGTASPAAPDGSPTVPYSNVSDDCTVRYVHINGGWTPSSSLTNVGAGLMTNDSRFGLGTHGLYQENITAEFCYLQNIRTEAMYVGNNFYPAGTTSDARAPLRNIVIRYNYFDTIGYNAVNLKSCWAGGEIYGNTCRSGGRGQPGEGLAITALSSSCEIHDNWIEDWAEVGIQHLVYAGPTVAQIASGGYTATADNPFKATIYNNVLSDIGKYAVNDADSKQPTGISVSCPSNLVPSQALVYNNSIYDVDAPLSDEDPNGIRVGFNGTPGRISNNIVLGLGTGGVAITKGGSQESNNTTTGSASDVWTSPSTKVFTLKAAAVPDTNLVAVDNANTDLATYNSQAVRTGIVAWAPVARSGVTPNQGAYEYP